MHELAEVETIRRQLAPYVEGRTIVRAVVGDPRWTRPMAPTEVEAGLPGRRVENLGRRGKYLVWSLSGDRHLLVHLRMTGALLYDPLGVPSPHARSWLELDHGHPLVYVAPRLFGTAHPLASTA